MRFEFVINRKTAKADRPDDSTERAGESGSGNSMRVVSGQGESARVSAQSLSRGHFAPPRLAAPLRLRGFMRYRIFHGRCTRNTCLRAKYPNGSRLRPASHHCRKELGLCFGLHRPRYNPTLDI